MATKKKPVSTMAHTLTAEQRKKVGTLAHRVWDEIGYECINAIIEDSGGKKRTISRRDVIEITTDAGRMEDLAERENKRTPGAYDDVVMNFLKKGTYDDMLIVLTPQFAYATYGL